jgi:hypothetical protein
MVEKRLERRRRTCVREVLFPTLLNPKCPQLTFETLSCFFFCYCCSVLCEIQVEYKVSFLMCA